MKLPVTTLPPKNSQKRKAGVKKNKIGNGGGEGGGRLAPSKNYLTNKARPQVWEKQLVKVNS